MANNAPNTAIGQRSLKSCQICFKILRFSKCKNKIANVTKQVQHQYRKYYFPQQLLVKVGRGKYVYYPPKNQSNVKNPPPIHNYVYVSYYFSISIVHTNSQNRIPTPIISEYASAYGQNEIRKQGITKNNRFRPSLKPPNTKRSV